MFWIGKWLCVCAVAAAQQELTGDLESNETNTEESSQVAVQSNAGKNHAEAPFLRTTVDTTQ